MTRLTFRAYIPQDHQQRWRSTRSAQVGLLAVIALAAFVLASGVSVTPRTIAFFPITVGSTEIQHVDVANRGPGMMRVDRIRFEGRDATAFHSEPAPCSGILSGETCELDIDYQPDSSGPHAATMWITDSSGLEHRVELAGSAKPAPINIAPRTLQFGEVQVGSTKTSQSRLSAPGTFQISGVRLNGADREDFEAESSSCTALPISQSGFCVINVSFKPNVPRVSRALVSFADKVSGQSYSIDLIGLGVVPQTAASTPVPITHSLPRIAIDPHTLDFTPPNRLRQPIVVRNAGSGILHLQVRTTADNSDRFKADPHDCVALNASAQCVITVTYKPKIFGRGNDAREQLVIAHDDPNTDNPVVIPLIWKMTESPKVHVTATPPQLTFAISSRNLAMITREPSIDRPTQEVSIRNELDSTPLTQLNLRLGFFNQDANGPFGYTTNCHEHLDTGEECKVLFEFKPKNADDLKKTGRLYVFEGMLDPVADVPLKVSAN